MPQQKLTDLQIDLLKVYAFQPNESDVLAIRQLLANYFSEKLIQKISQSVDNQQISESTLNSWLNE